MNESSATPHLYVLDMEPNTPVAGYYILNTASLRTTGNGKTFLSASITDRTGTVNVIYWDYNGPLRSSDEGKTVFIRGQISEFKGALQITLEAIRPANDSDIIDRSTLVPTAPIDADKM